MRKVFLSIISLLCILLLVACSNSAPKKDEKNKDDLNQTKTSASFDMTLTSAKLVDNELNTDAKHITLELGIKAKNIDKKEVAIGTGDFYILDKDNKKYTFTGNENNFGDVIKEGKTLKGKGYYSIPESAKGKDMVVVYRPFRSTEQIKWNIHIPDQVMKAKK